MSYVHITRTRGHGLPEYRRVLSALGEAPIPGRRSHEVGEADGSLCILDVWESRAAADSFAAQRLFPAFEDAGVRPQADTTIIAFETADHV